MSLWVDLVRRTVPLPVREPINRLRWRNGAKASYSAFGEDLIVRAWLEEAAKVPAAEISYLDIGASHPTVLSNTYLLYRIGGSGVLVEPNPVEGRLIARLRPRDTLVPAGVAFDERTEATLFQFPTSALNTFDDKIARWIDTNNDPWAIKEKITARLSVPLIPANTIIREHFTNRPCHFLTIDAEGFDEPILASIDFDHFMPWIICIEGRPSERPASAARLTDLGYAVMAATPHNSLFGLREKIGVWT